MMRLWTCLLRLGISLFVLAALSSRVSSAWAHGGGALQLSNAVAGPYLVSVWTQTDILRLGSLHITVAVSQPAPDNGNTAGEPVLGAVVRVVAQPLPEGEGSPLAALATNDAALNKLYYETDFELTKAGLWRFQIEVDGPSGSGVTSFEKEVRPAVTVGWPVWVGIVGVLVLAGWLAQSRARPRTMPVRPARPSRSSQPRES